MIREFLLYFGASMALVAWAAVAVLWRKLAALTTAWNRYHCRHEKRLDRVEKELGLGFWSPEKAGGQELARQRTTAGGEQQ